MGGVQTPPPPPAGGGKSRGPAGLGLTINDTTFYETLIMMLRGETVKYSKQKAKRSRAVGAIILSDISAAEAKFIATGAQSEALHLDMLKSKLEEHRSPIIDGLIVRLRVSWHEHGERSSKYFLSLEKRNFNTKCIQYIKDDDKIISRTEEIIENMSHILQNKYNVSNDTTNDHSLVRNHVRNKLNHDDQV